MDKENQPTIPFDKALPKNPMESEKQKPTIPATSGRAPAQPVGTSQATVILPSASKAAPSFAWLVYLTGPKSGRTEPIGDDAITIGRGTQNKIALEEVAVSREHARVARDPAAAKKYYLVDVGSANGTYVNGKKVARKVLQDDDHIRIGETVLVFKIVGKPKTETKPKPAKPK
ncbi:MAG: FHA domain-containing protein [Chloroflexi bacterium]|nr:FHA domain-containing protein [Chloroflexota bacterium]